MMPSPPEVSLMPSPSPPRSNSHGQLSTPTTFTGARSALDCAPLYLPQIVVKLLESGTPLQQNVRNGFCASMFADLSGFTSITEELSAFEDGAERITNLLDEYFTVLLGFVEDTKGDVVSFAGDAVLVSWFCEEDGLVEAAEKALECCRMINGETALADWEVEVPGKQSKRLGYHIGVGAGRYQGLLLGSGRSWKYVVAGEAVHQATLASNMVRRGFAFSSQAMELLKDQCKGTPLEDNFQEVRFTQGEQPTHFKKPPDSAAPSQLDISSLQGFEQQQEINDKAKSFLFDGILRAKNNHEGQLRPVCSIFVKLKDQVTDMSAIDIRDFLVACKILFEQLNRYDGICNKIIADDKGLVVLCVFGLPYHSNEDNIIRGAQFALTICDKISRVLGPIYVGMTFAKVFCGIVGGQCRREYTVIGSGVNLSARLMIYGQQTGGFTYKITCGETAFKFLSEDADGFMFADPKTIELKGIAHKVRMAYLLKWEDPYGTEGSVSGRSNSSRGSKGSSFSSRSKRARAGKFMGNLKANRTTKPRPVVERNMGMIDSDDDSDDLQSLASLEDMTHIQAINFNPGPNKAPVPLPAPRIIGRCNEKAAIDYLFEGMGLLNLSMGSISPALRGAAGGVRLLMITGDAGTGKSILLEYAAWRAQFCGCQWLLTSGGSRHNTPLTGIKELLHDLLELYHTSKKEWRGELGGEFTQFLPWLRQIHPDAVPEEAVKNIPERHNIEWETPMSDFYALGLALLKPLTTTSNCLVILVDDSQFMDPVSLNFLSTILLSTNNVIIVIARRYPPLIHPGNAVPSDGSTASKIPKLTLNVNAIDKRPSVASVTSARSRQSSATPSNPGPLSARSNFSRGSQLSQSSERRRQAMSSSPPRTRSLRLNGPISRESRPSVQSSHSPKMSNSHSIQVEAVFNNPGLSAAVGSRDVHLENLSGPSFKELCITSTSRKVTESFCTVLYKLTGGNPGLVELMIEHLTEKGHTTDDGNLMDIRDPQAAEAVDIPLAAESVIHSKLDELPDEYVNCVKLASVIGQEFTTPMMVKCTKDPSKKVEMLLDSLTTNGFFSVTTKGEPQYWFKNEIFRRVIYGGILFAERKRMHKDIAMAFNDGTVSVKPHLLAHHFLCAADLDMASEFVDESLHTAIENTQYSECLRILNQYRKDSKSKELLPLEWLCFEAIAYNGLGISDKGLTLAQECMDELNMSPEAVGGFHRFLRALPCSSPRVPKAAKEYVGLLILQCDCYMQQGRCDLALILAEEALYIVNSVEECQNFLSVAHAWMAYLLLFHKLSVKKANYHMAHAQSLGPCGERKHVYFELTMLMQICLRNLGDHEEALKYLSGNHTFPSSQEILYNALQGDIGAALMRGKATFQQLKDIPDLQHLQLEISVATVTIGLLWYGKPSHVEKEMDYLKNAEVASLVSRTILIPALRSLSGCLEGQHDDGVLIAIGIANTMKPTKAKMFTMYHILAFTALLEVMIEGFISRHSPVAKEVSWALQQLDKARGAIPLAEPIFLYWDACWKSANFKILEASKRFQEAASSASERCMPYYASCAMYQMALLKGSKGRYSDVTSTISEIKAKFDTMGAARMSFLAGQRTNNLDSPPSPSPRSPHLKLTA